MSGLFFNEYPYTDFHQLNLTWLVGKITELNETVKNFVSLETIKYANPIQWNITTQYEKNTVVVDPQTGTAYISVQPVPTGIGITNTDYWSVIFTLDVISANKNITLRDDGSNVLASFASAEDDWLLWNGTLYKVSQAIALNEAYVVGYNLTRYTVEMFISDYISALNTIIGNLTNLTTTDKTSIVNAINELVTSIGGLSNLTTTDKTSIVNAVNELVTSIGGLSNLTTTDKTSIVNAVNELVTSIGSLSNLATTDKSSIVNAINEIVNNPVQLTVKDFGAVGDGVTDDTQAILDCIADNDIVIFPSGTYLYNTNYDIHDKIFIGSNATIITSGSIRFFDCTVMNLTLDTVNGVLSDGKCTFNGCFFDCQHHALNVNNAVDVTDGSQAIFENCEFDGAQLATMGIWANEAGGSAILKVNNCKFINFYLNAIFSSAQVTDIANSTFNNNHLQTSPTGGGHIDLGAVAGVKAVATIRNCQIIGGNSLTCGIETGATMWLTVESCNVNVSVGTYAVALQAGTYATLIGNSFQCGSSFQCIGTTGGSKAISLGNYYIGTVAATPADVLFSQEFYP